MRYFITPLNCIHWGKKKPKITIKLLIISPNRVLEKQALITRLLKSKLKTD